MYVEISCSYIDSQKYPFAYFKRCICKCILYSFSFEITYQIAAVVSSHHCYAESCHFL